MTSLSAGATAGLLVALMVAATNDAVLPSSQPTSGTLSPGADKSFNPKLAPQQDRGAIASQR